MDHENMKRKVAGTLKWNTIDKVASQVLYAVTGIVLARLLSQEDFGLIGAVLVFQSFASLFVDSGFSFALLQRKSPTATDYSSVFWFNLAMAVLIYAILWCCAPLIAAIFDNDQRLIPLSRVMFLSFILNASSIVQINVLMKQMDVKMVAISNTIALATSGVVGIWLAIAGYGAWAIVWQTITLGAVKSLVLWLHGHWRPTWQFSWPALRSFFSVGFGVMGTSALNILFQNIYSFFIGVRNGMVSLGYYTQAEKWSKMGIASLSQILNTSFLPALAQYQDSPAEFSAVAAKMHRLSAYLTFPAIGFLIVMSAPIFHILFGTKWDPAIILFQLLLVRGIFTILTALYNQYFIAVGRTRLMLAGEIVRDVLAIVALVLTLPYIDLSSATQLCYGVEIMLWGQIAASGIAWAAILVMAAAISYRKWWQFIIDLVPYVAQVAAIMCVISLVPRFTSSPWLQLACELTIGFGLYLALNAALGSKIQRDALQYLRKRS